MQIVRGGKLSQFSRISLQSRMFSSENFLSYYKVFPGFKMADSGPGSGPGLLRYFKPCRKDSCQIPLECCRLPKTVQLIIPPRRIKIEHMVEMFLGRCPTISSPALQTVTAYRSLGLPGLFLHASRSPRMGVQLS